MCVCVCACTFIKCVSESVSSTDADADDLLLGVLLTNQCTHTYRAVPCPLVYRVLLVNAALLPLNVAISGECAYVRMGVFCQVRK